jgi:hypothetical protein
MKVFTIGRLGGVVVLAGAMLVVAGAPAAATEAVCAPRTVSVSDDVEVEGGPSGGRQLSFVLTTTGCLAGTVEFVTSFTATTPGPWAIAPYDYTALGGTAVWARHSTSSITVTVPIVGDEWVELDENVTLVLRNPSSAVTLTETTAVGTIRNDDLTQVGGDSEPDCGMTAAWTCPFTIELSRRVAFDVTVVFATGNGTASAGQEFVGVPRGTVVIPAGALQGTATITLLPGFGLPTAKHFFVDLLETSVGTLGVSRLRLTIPAP